MPRSPRERALYLISLLFAVAPFAFGIVRALRTGHDLRMLWMAFAAFLGASAIEAIGKARTRKGNVVLAFSVVTFIVTTLAGGITAYLLGATSAPGVWGVAIVFGLLWTGSYALDTLSRPRVSG
ncbi:MAG: hypothetical protein ACJ78M_01100 [Gemmatimonadaceae bacterium]